MKDLASDELIIPFLDFSKPFGKRDGSFEKLGIFKMTETNENEQCLWHF